MADAVKDLIAGSCGGIAIVLTGHPLDTLKVRLQTSGVGNNPQFNGLADVFKQTIKNEGFGGLYKGVASPLAGAAFLNAVVFFTWGTAQKVMRSQKEPGADLSFGELFVGGAITGSAVSFVEGPVDLFKSKMQVQYGSGQGAYKSTFDCARSLATTYGIRGVYQGLGATQLRNIPAYAFYFGFYEFLRRTLSGDSGNKTLSPGAVLVAGGLGGIGFWASSYPFDVIKTHIQTDSSDISQRKYKHSLDCAMKIYRNEGIRGFWRGFTPCLIRAFPVNAACFFTYEFVRKLLG